MPDGGDREAWLARRRKNIGGSEIAALFGCQAEYQMSHYALWHVKAGRIPEAEVGGERPRWGLALEDAIAEAVRQEWKWRVSPGFYVEHPTVKGLGCTLDRVAVRPDAEPALPGCMEMKNIDWLTHKRGWVGSPPVHIELQLQHQLACTGYEWGAVVALVGGNHLAEPYIYGRRPKIIAAIEQKVADFWKSIADGREPPTDASASTAAALKALFPEAKPEKEIELGGNNEFGDRLMALKQARLDKAAAEATERAAANWIMATVGDAEVIKSGGVVVATAKTQHRKAHEVKASMSRPLLLKEVA
jgi:predicted phage-related endonuclease